MMVSAMQTMEEESIPPLNSARIGLSERSLRRTASANTIRKCSSYRAYKNQENGDEEYLKEESEEDSEDSIEDLPYQENPSVPQTKETDKGQEKQQIESPEVPSEDDSRYMLIQEGFVAYVPGNNQ